MRRLIARMLCEERGQDLIEYALLAAFISIIAVSAITGIGQQVNSWYEGYNVTVSKIPGGGGS
jgi:Flp pilus assembly pilin Flp